MTGLRGFRRAAVLVLVLGAVTACQSAAVRPGAANPAGSAGTTAARSSCLAPAGPLPGGTAGPRPGGTAGPLPGGSATASPSGPPLPDLAMDCMTGGRASLAQLGGPALINLWASSCGPCRTELPALQSFHDRAGAAVAVLGVATLDRRSGAESLRSDLGLSYPMLWDPDGALLRAIGRTTLPVTLFVGVDGRIAYVYTGAALTEPAVETLAQRHLGVRVGT